MSENGVIQSTGRAWLIAGGLSGQIAIVAGAFGTHGIKKNLTPEMLAIFETAVRYEMYHALALVACGLWQSRSSSRAFQTAGWAFVIGTLLFSGSLYLLALTGAKWLGVITPFGGLAFFVGWGALFGAGWSRR